jgi:hypothetical protein
MPNDADNMSVSENGLRHFFTIADLLTVARYRYIRISIPARFGVQG